MIGCSADEEPRVPKVHRAASVSCIRTRGPGSPGSDPHGCQSDADCGGINGRCYTWYTNNICTFDACFTDADCSDGKLCECARDETNGGGSLGHHCVGTGNCRVDADCGANGFCSPSYGWDRRSGSEGYFCHTPNDQCIDDSDCPNSAPCHFNQQSARWECL